MKRAGLVLVVLAALAVLVALLWDDAPAGVAAEGEVAAAPAPEPEGAVELVRPEAVAAREGEEPQAEEREAVAPSQAGGAEEARAAEARATDARLEVLVTEVGTGRPLAGVSVSVGGPSARVAGTNALVVPDDGGLVTDEDGLVAFDVPAEQRVYLFARLPPGESVSREEAPLAAGEVRRVEIELFVAGELRVRGRVVRDEDGSPVSGATVEVRARSGTPVRTLTSGADGSFAVEVDGRVPSHLVASAPGRSPRRVQLADGLTDGELEVEVRLRRSAALELAVLGERLEGVSGVEARLTAPSYHLRQGAALRIWMDSEDLDYRRSTDASGTCVFEELPSEVPFTLVLRPPGDGPPRRHAEAVRLRPGERRALEVRLGGDAAIRGVVVDALGDPIPGLRLWLVRVAHADVRRRIHDSMEPEARTTTEVDGRFAFESAAAGCYLVGVEPRDPGAAVSPELVELVPGGGDRELRLEAHRGLAIEGRALGPDDLPVPGVVVFASGPSTHHHAQTDEQGGFRFEPLLPGTWTLSSYFARDGLVLFEPVEVEAGARDVLLRLERGGTLRGRILDARGAPASGELWLSDLDGGLRGVPTEAGSFEVVGLPEGTYSLALRTRTGECAVLPGVVLGAGQVVDGLVLTTAPGGRLVVSYEGPDDYGQARVRSQGTVVAADGIEHGGSVDLLVPAGELVVELSDARTRGGEPQRRTVVVAAGETRTVAFE